MNEAICGSVCLRILMGTPSEHGGCIFCQGVVVTKFWSLCFRVRCIRPEFLCIEAVGCLRPASQDGFQICGVLLAVAGLPQSNRVTTTALLRLGSVVLFHPCDAGQAHLLGEDNEGDWDALSTEALPVGGQSAQALGLNAVNPGVQKHAFHPQNNLQCVSTSHNGFRPKSVQAARNAAKAGGVPMKEIARIFALNQGGA